MKEFINVHKYFFIGLILTLSLLWPLFAGPYFTHHDDVQTIRLYEMDKCIQDGQIPCRWVPDLGGVYGYPLFNYYAPLPYYFGEIFYLITHSLLISAKIMFGFSFIGSYVLMYLFAKKFWGKIGGSLAAIFYILAPYHALDFYVRGAMGELWGLMFFPGILWAFTKLEEKVNLGNLLLLASFIFGLIISHNLSAMICVPTTLIFCILLFFKRKQQKFLWFSLISLLFGFILSSFYFLPVIFEKNLVHVETTTYGYFHYTEHFKGLRKVLIERIWGYGASVREVPGGERDGMSFQIGWIHLLGWVIGLISGWKLWKKNRFLSITILVSSLFVLLAIFMIHPRSQFVWDAIEPLMYLQFPWRFLMIVIFYISFIAGSFVLITPEKWQKKIWVGLFLLVILGNFSYFRPEKFIQITDSELLIGQNWDRVIKRSIFDYLPIYAKAPPAELAVQRYEILTGDSEIIDFKEGSNWISFKTNTKSHTILRLSQYYFPNWKIFVDGKEVILDYKNNDLGLMTFILGEGNHEIYGRLYDTQIRSISNTLTLLGFLIWVVLLLTSFKRFRRWLEYYRKRIN